MKKICGLTTLPITIKSFMLGNLNYMADNGYKAYGPDGCQITSEAADAISKAIAETDTFTGVKSMDFDEALEQGLVKWIDDSCLERYYDARSRPRRDQPFCRGDRWRSA